MADRDPWVFDSEIYPNFFLVIFKNIVTGKVVSFEMADGEEIDGERLDRFIRNHLIIGFNSRNFDIVILYLAIAGYPVKVLKEAVDKIIFDGLRPWEIEREYDIKIPRDLDHIDLIEVPKGSASLKLYNGRLHGRRMQDLPFEPDTILTPKQMDETYDYCLNDLDATKLLFEKVRPQIALRESMSAEYGEDLRSKSDAQIAEAVIKAQVAELIDEKPKPQNVRPGAGFRYAIPDFIRFRSDMLNDLLDDVERATFKISEGGKVLMPKALQDAEIRIGSSIYRLGIGGLHSSEKTVAYEADADTILVDRDVTSYYPAIIINLGLHPKNMGWAFLKVYKRIVNRRIKAKKDGNKVAADSLKIVVNGSFGKFGSRWSTLYSPNLLIQTTVTGQLSLLMFIERLEDAGIEVISANTDGVVIRCPKTLKDRMLEIVREWELDTGFQTEETEYRAIYSRDVNNYIAIKTNGEAKAKGAFADASLEKNPANEICIEAVKAKLVNGTPIHKTIMSCRDITKFVTIRTVRGGAIWGDQFLGKAIRWYYSCETKGSIHSKIPTKKGTHSKVPRTEGARPLMQLPDAFPDDVDYRWYIREARSILEDIGYDAAVI